MAYSGHVGRLAIEDVDTLDKEYIKIKCKYCITFWGVDCSARAINFLTFSSDFGGNSKSTAKLNVFPLLKKLKGKINKLYAQKYLSSIIHLYMQVLLSMEP